jgi:hypothetical protein
MLFSPMTPAHIAAPPHEHQPLLLQEAAGLRPGPSITKTLKTDFSGRLEIRSITQIRLGQVNTQLFFFEYHSVETAGEKIAAAHADARPYRASM